MKRSIIPKKARGPGRPSGRFTQHRRIEGMRELLEAHGQGATIEELATVMRVSTRSVKRYLRDLKEQLGLEPVPTVPGGPNRWRVKPSERGRSITLRRTQAYLLLAARSAFEPLRGSALFDEIDVAHRQLLQVAERPLRTAHTVDIQPTARLEDRVVVVPYPARSYVASGGDLDEIFRAAAELRVVQFRFRDEARVRVCPYVIALHDGAVHCVGLDVARDAVRAFPLEGIRDATTEAQRFELPIDFDPERLVLGAFGPVETEDRRRAVIEFDARVADEVRTRKHHPDQRVATSKDGRVRLAMPVGDRTALVRWVLGFGAAARVIEPDDVRDLVREELSAALRKNG
ncbi:MAG TPA: WYL domain-containing transcriptional regulator [Polyangiaceae bacterium]|jgi:predicted DNA-binding transcriptional regulator YafY